MYDYYWDSIIPLSLMLIGVSIALVLLLETTSNLFSSYHRSKLKRRAFVGLLGVLSWWWVAALSLQLTNELAMVIVPSLSELTLFETVSLGAVGLLITAFALVTELIIFVSIALIYLVRQLVLYLFVLLMPILIVLWIPGVGPFRLMSGFMRKLAGFYVPFLFMPIPVAILFRLGDLLGNSFSLSFGGIGAWLTALVIPILALFAPIVLVWQAGSIFSLGQRVSSHTTRPRTPASLAPARRPATAARLGSDNFVRGTRGKLAKNGDGQTLLDSRSSRAHSAGARVRRLRERVRPPNTDSPAVNAGSSRHGRLRADPNDPAGPNVPQQDSRYRRSRRARRTDRSPDNHDRDDRDNRDDRDDRPPYIN